jgi:signal transduction histidine kinase
VTASATVGQPGAQPVAQLPSSDALLRAVLAISGELDLRNVLRRVVAAAVDLTGARYGALGVIGGNGQLSEFVTTGLDPQVEAAIGARPRGEGLLGLLLRDPRPIRLADLREHPASVGVPPNHPPMHAFLGAPIRIRGTVFGNLYLTDKVGGEFTEADESLVVALAQAAALVIDSARIYGLSEQRRQWLEASAEVGEALQPPIGVAAALQEIVSRARAASGASFCAVVELPAVGAPRISATDGAVGVPLVPLVARLVEEVRAADAGATPVDVDLGDQWARVVPMTAHLDDPAVLIVLQESGAMRVDEERDLLAAFVDHASIALERAQALADREELALVSERARIARDLHDVVIQRLFAAGLKLQALQVQDRQLAEKVDDLVGELDLTIKEIRTTIFGLQRRPRASVRGAVVDLVEDYVEVLGFRPSVHFDGPVDLVVSDRIAEHLVAVLREALSNVARHAQAGSAAVEVSVADGTVTLVVTDAGIGIAPHRTESGLRNVRERAESLGGSVEVSVNTLPGTTVRWSCPLDPIG